MQVITQKDKNDKTLEPYEEAVVEVPETHMGGVVDLMGSRKGQMVDMSASAEGLNRVTYVIPTRGLLGLRNSILTATKVCILLCRIDVYLAQPFALLMQAVALVQVSTISISANEGISSEFYSPITLGFRAWHDCFMQCMAQHVFTDSVELMPMCLQGTAVLNTVFKEYGPWAGDINTRELGSLVAFETGSVTGYAIESVQQRGRLFASPGQEVYVDQVGAAPESSLLTLCSTTRSFLIVVQAYRTVQDCTGLSS